MTAAWMVKNENGQLLAELAGASRVDVGRKVLPGNYDAFRLHVSSSYRALFDRALSQILEQKGWEIVQVRPRRRPAHAALG